MKNPEIIKEIMFIRILDYWFLLQRFWMDGIMIFFPEIKGVKILRKSLKIRYR